LSINAWLIVCSAIENYEKNLTDLIFWETCPYLLDSLWIEWGRLLKTRLRRFHGLARAKRYFILNGSGGLGQL
jgi:hypothetical protein